MRNDPYGYTCHTAGALIPSFVLSADNTTREQRQVGDLPPEGGETT